MPEEKEQRVKGLINMHYPEMWGFVQFSERMAGSGTEPFVWNPVEDAKWALRRVYYRERTHRDDRGRYTDRVDDLGLSAISLDGYTWPPQITSTANTFTASVTDSRQTHAVHIRQDGRVWVEVLEPHPSNVQESTWGQVKGLPGAEQ